jgi:ABC-2 type transport system ATP-binding protein
MPENVPLYTDMRVSEYLTYRGNLKGVHGRRLKKRLGEVMELCSLEEVKKKLIGALSKGYRQRVGLADALIHSPDLLILDEPTIGLDPTQIRHVRALITDLAKHHTILLSTHILSEVEKTCSRVIIINHGNIEASDTPQNLVQTLRSGTGVRLEANVANENPAEYLRKISGVKEVEFSREGDWSTILIRVDGAADVREEVFRVASDRKWKVRELTRRRATLEDVFVELTQAD